MLNEIYDKRIIEIKELLLPNEYYVKYDFDEDSYFLIKKDDCLVEKFDTIEGIKEYFHPKYNIVDVIHQLNIGEDIENEILSEIEVK